jgi:mRNA interferase RelE/StbE
VTHTVVWEHHAMNEFRRLRASDPVGAKATAAAVGELAGDPRPEAAMTVHVLKVGRSN